MARDATAANGDAAHGEAAKTRRVLRKQTRQNNGTRPEKRTMDMEITGHQWLNTAAEFNVNSQLPAHSAVKCLPNMSRKLGNNHSKRFPLMYPRKNGMVFNTGPEQKRYTFHMASKNQTIEIANNVQNENVGSGLKLYFS